jgi:hypothetical protein
MGTIVYLGSKKSKPPQRRPERATESKVLIEVVHGQVRANQVSALTAEDASALLTGLAMALVQVVRARQIL